MVLSKATGVDSPLSSATIPMVDKFSFHCPPEGEGDTDARPSISDSESDVDQDLADVTPSRSMIGEEGKATPQEETGHQQRDKDTSGRPDAQTNGFTARPTDEHFDRTPSPPWKDPDTSVAISILIPLLSWAFGRDYVKVIFVGIFLVYYLYQLIEVPWQLYHASRRRRPVPGIPSPRASDKRISELASAELWRHEMTYLCLAALAPFLGVFFLRTVVSSISGEDAVPWFSTTVFVLASSFRPWLHIVSRLRHRVRDLHDAIHYPSPESQLIPESRIQAVLDRVEQLERELDRVKRTTVQHAVQEAYNEIFDALEDLERAFKKQDKKVETSRTLTEARLAEVEAITSRFETQGKLFDQPGSVLKRLLVDLACWFPLRLLDVLSFIRPSKSTASAEKGKGSVVAPSYHPYSPPSRRPPRLETIPENGDPSAVFIPSNSGNSPRTAMRRRRPTRHPEPPKESDPTVGLLSQAVLLPFYLSVRVLTAIFTPIKTTVS